MALHTDIPTASDLETLISVRRRGCVAIYLPTSPITTEAADADRTELKNLAKEAVAQLEAGQTDHKDVAAVRDSLAELDDDEAFWARQAHSLAVFASPTGPGAFACRTGSSRWSRYPTASTSSRCCER